MLVIPVIRKANINSLAARNIDQGAYLTTDDITYVHE